MFGYFCHRCFVSFTKLSIAGIERLFHDFLAWLRSDADPRFVTPPGYAQIRRDVITNGQSSRPLGYSYPQRHNLMRFKSRALNIELPPPWN